MSKFTRKRELKRKIGDSEREIIDLERRRTRSQSAIMEAIINERTPDDSDKEYFKVFTSLIEVERNNLRKLREELDNL